MAQTVSTRHEHEKVVAEVNEYLSFRTINCYEIKKTVTPLGFDEVTITITMTKHDGMRI